LQLSLSKIVKNAFQSSCEEFQRIVAETTSILSSEDGQVGNFHIVGRLVKMKPAGNALIIGDMHGDFESLIQVLEESKILGRMQSASDQMVVFLGDYGDRGPLSVEIYYTVLKLKLHFPGQVVLMRGNHEGPKDLMASPHDLPGQLQIKFGQKWTKAYRQLLALHQHLYSASAVQDRYLMIHGGLPEQARTLDDLAFAHLKHPNQQLLEDMLWSDPDETEDQTRSSPRGAGKLFGKRTTDEVLDRLNFKVLIRGHEPCQEGFKLNHDGKVLTLFSRKGPPYFNEHGAYLDVDLSRKVENAEQLVDSVCSF
jgi:protein phosphatase